MESKEYLATEIARFILSELDHLEENFIVREPHSLDSDASDVDRLLHIKSWSLFYDQQLVKKELSIGFCSASENGKETFFLFFRHGTPHMVKPSNSNVRYVSYLSPMGALASRVPGRQCMIAVPNGKRYFDVNSTNIFRSIKEHCCWDAKENRISLKDMKFSIKSLLMFMAKNEKLSSEIYEVENRPLPAMNKQAHANERFSIDNFLENFRAEEGDIEKISTPTVRAFSLNDNPILDSTQDAIFRVDLNKKIVITGAPGTGKSTVLIKRLSQKTKYEFLSDSEKKHFDKIDFYTEVGPDKGWVLFCPNELLRNYLKETMNKENLSATNKTVKAWDHEKINIARDCYNILKIKNKGHYRLALEESCKIPNYSYTQMGLEFEQYFIGKLYTNFSELREKILLYIKNVEEILSHLFVESQTPGKLLKQRLVEKNFYKETKLFHLHSTFVFINSAFEEVRHHVESSTLTENSASILNLIRRIHDKFYLLFSDRSSKNNDLLQNDSDGPVSCIYSALNKIKKAFILSVSASGFFEEFLKNNLVDKTYSKNEKNDLIAALFYCLIGFKFSEKYIVNTGLVDLFNNIIVNSLELKLLIEIAENIFSFIQDCVYISDANNLIAYCIDVFSEFRSSNLNYSKLFKFKDGYIGSSELDIVLYSVQKLSWICNRNRVYLDSKVRRPGFTEYKKMIKKLAGVQETENYLDNIRHHYRYYICIDEVADFSALQIGTILFLSNPSVFSITIAGDLMQRTTYCGISSWDDLNILLKSPEKYTLQKVYRLNPKLLGIAQKLYQQFLGEVPYFISPYEDVGYPTPLKYIGNEHDCAVWIAERIIEIYEHYNYLPSIAVFVPKEKDIDVVCELLVDKLYINAIETETCHEGKVLGNSTKVRIFSVEYIKGLEFDCVFFWMMDRLDKIYPGLIEKFLYVGLTRAASFLALTTESSFPVKLDGIINEFKDSSCFF